MTQINAYVNFNGKCREAMSFYKECLGGELTLNLVESSPIASQMPPDAGQMIMHAMLVNKGIILMGSDMIGGQLIQGNAVTLSINCSSEEEANNFFSKLSEGGKVTHPFAMMFWGAMFGTFTDKFETNWMINFDQNAH